jgi:hypothetical protein
MAYIMATTPDPAWLTSCLASALFWRLGDDRERMIGKILAGGYGRTAA